MTHVFLRAIKTDEVELEKRRIPRSDTLEYRAAYNIGWRYSARETATLDHVDSRYRLDPRYNAILDGYLDYAAGRARWHLLRCPNHGGSNEPGTCGEG